MVLDSGADRTIIPGELASSLGLDVHDLDKNVCVTYGDGGKEIVTKGTVVGGIESLISNQVLLPLLSLNDLVDKGNKLNLNMDGGTIYPPEEEDPIDIIRSGKQWLVEMNDLIMLEKRLNEKDQYYKSLSDNSIDVREVKINFSENSIEVSKTDSSSIRSKVIRLHERMAHPSTKVMREAIKFGCW
jgi:hypothetical protein